MSSSEEILWFGSGFLEEGYMCLKKKKDTGKPETWRDVYNLIQVK